MELCFRRLESLAPLRADDRAMLTSLVSETRRVGSSEVLAECGDPVRHAHVVLD